MRVLILGADGYLGWPTCMFLSQKGYEVIGVDNYLRRNASVELDCEPLIPVPNLIRRAEIWKEITGKNIYIHIGDVTNYGFLISIFKEYNPDVVIHYAEQPSAPYSMINREKATLTVHNNLISTLNIVYAVKETNLDTHIIKLGTMGEYGTPNIDIEEGWIEIEHKGRKDKFLFPRQASSLYHTTKIQDTDMLWFYVRTWGIRVTDLMQGPVYGLFTNESGKNEKLLTFFNYDEVFGTVLNRFVVQAAAGYPLTVYGKGNQTRGFLNIKDTLNCVELSLENPPTKGELRIFNQFTETFSVNELAERVKRVGNNLGLNVRIQSVENPRKEAEEHYYNPTHTGLIDLGLKPHFLTDEVIAEMIEFVLHHKGNIQEHKIFRRYTWL